MTASTMATTQKSSGSPAAAPSSTNTAATIGWPASKGAMSPRVDGSEATASALASEAAIPAENTATDTPTMSANAAAKPSDGARTARADPTSPTAPRPLRAARWVAAMIQG